MDGARSGVSLVLVLLLVSPGPLGLQSASGDDGCSIAGGIPPFDDPTTWIDDFIDAHLVNTTMGVAIASGEVRLLPGESHGLVASKAIPCPADYRYDLLWVEASTPGGSRVLVSVLNATEDSVQVGYVNEPVPGFQDLETRDVSLGAISPAAYPEIRLQADLWESGSDEPILLRWAVLFVPVDEWRDDFLGTGKMDSWRGVNVTAGDVSVDLSGPASAMEYEAYPPVLFTWTNQPSYFDAFLPNAGRTGYQSATTIGCTGTFGLAVDDLNLDGFLDLVCANSPHGGQDKDSQIYWGSSSGTWSPAGAKDLQTVGAERAATGDFDGDGDVDIIITTLRTSATVDTVVFLDRGGGDYPHAPDIVLVQNDPRNADTGDLNGDGYDDIVLAEDSVSRAFFGGPGGPDTTPDISFQVGSRCDEVKVRDLDGDGLLDVMFATTRSGKALVFLGGEDGPDTTPDYSLTVPGTTVYGCGSGDLNGDGYTDLVFSGSSPATLRIFKGSAQGWSDGRVHDITPGGTARVADLLDVDKDGYDDLLVGEGDQFRVYPGDTTWPTTHSISLTMGITSPLDMAIAVPKGGAPVYRGSFVTEAITRPVDERWDILYLEGSFPGGTTTSITLLDGGLNGIAGYEDLEGRSLDLSGLASGDTIHVKVTFMSDSNLTTPVVDWLVVKWQDGMTWREQFYGGAKVDRTLNMGVEDLRLAGQPPAGVDTQLLFTSLRGDEGYGTPGQVFVDAGGLDFTTRPPVDIVVRGAVAADAADVDGDGFPDLAFAVYKTGDNTFTGPSPLFLGSALGWGDEPDHEFFTTGATAVILRDLNGDGHEDVVFAQEQDRGSQVSSVLYWGSPSGWASTPDVEFATSWATDALATDVDGDGDLDLVFACYQALTTNTDSMVFLQESTGFCGTAPSRLLATKGATCVAAGDLDRDGRVDLVFGNSFLGGSAETDSFVYWGRPGGTFDASPTHLPTSGVEDVTLADVDGDADLDVVFANGYDNSLRVDVDSSCYLNDGGGGFASSPDLLLPTMGASAVAATDLDGTGWLDLVFASSTNGTGHRTDSLVYLGGAGGWSSLPDLALPTTGASGVLAAGLLRPGSGGYMSRTIRPEDPSATGTFHTLRYDASMDAGVSATLMVLDVDTRGVLAKTPVLVGENEWNLVGAFSVRDHPSIRVAVAVEGMTASRGLSIDDLWLNWTERVHRPPRVLDADLSAPYVLRTHIVTLWVNATDEYDPPKALVLTVEHALNGSGTWSSNMVGARTFRGGTWTVSIVPPPSAPVGNYDLRVRVEDMDGDTSQYLVLPGALSVINNLPTTPVLRIEPARATTISTLTVEVFTPAVDVEASFLTYHYRWYRDGDLVADLTEDAVPAARTSKGENWSVEVRAFDGDDEGPPAYAWRMIENSGPIQANPLPDPEIDEDTTDSDWLNLLMAFVDPDGDPLSFWLSEPSLNLSVDIDNATGTVTITPRKNWSGRESIRFIASDGELQTSSQEVVVTVRPVNDPPVIAAIDDQPFTGGPLTFTVAQGELLTIRYTVVDPDGDEVHVSVNSTAFEVDEEFHQISFLPGNDDVGTLRLRLSFWDTVAPSVKVTVDLIVVVEDRNDPMDDPVITSPLQGAKYKAGQLFDLEAVCDDPDIRHGQVLNFTWTSNLSGVLGYGPSLTVNLTEVGTHRIDVTVRDPDFVKTASVEVVIESDGTGPPPPPPPDGDGTETGTNWALVAGVLLALAVLVAVLLVAVTRRRTRTREAELYAGEEPMDAAAQQLEALVRAREAVKGLADEWEADTGGAAPPAVEYEEVPAAPAAEWTAVPETREELPEAAPPTEEERAQLRLDALKRTYHNAIGTLPYGVPASELRDRDWVELASALATGEKWTTPEGKELTSIDGRWYYSGVDDPTTFLRAHAVERPAAEGRPTMEVTTERDRLLAKLEERFANGQISEESYLELKRKYGG